MNARDQSATLVRGMPIAEYHAHHALGSSGIKALARSPQHFYSTRLHPNRPPETTTPAMTAGTLAHCAILEPHALGERYAIKPAGHDGRTKEGKAWAAGVADGVEIVSAAQLTSAMQQSVALRGLPELARLLSDGEPEVSAFWTDAETGVECKCRPDWVAPVGDGVILVDVKTTQDASPEGFPRVAHRYGYPNQAAWYADGYERASGLHVLGFVFAVVEADWPHAAAAYMLPEEWLTVANRRNRELLHTYVECVSTNNWPGYGETIMELEMPTWLR